MTLSATELAYYESVDVEKVVTLTYGTVSRTCHFGVGAIQKFGDVLEALGIKHVGFVTSASAYKRCGAWAPIEAALKEKGVEYTLYNKIVTNPTCASIEEARELFLPHYNKDTFLVCSIGGGSPSDAAKSVSVLLEHQDKTANELYKFEFSAERRSKLVCVSTSAGTGTEVNQFAVASILDDPSGIPLKPALATSVIYPDMSIIDPVLLKSASPYQTAATALDAVNHVTEACSTTIATPFSTNLGRMVCDLVAHYLPEALKDKENIRARYWLHYASLLGGMSFNESLLHATHALEHTLSAYVPNLCHGAGLCLLQPAVVEHVWDDEAARKALAYVLEPIIGKFEGKPEEATEVAKALRAFHVSVGLDGTLATMGFKNEDVQKLVDSTIACPGMEGLLALSPVKITKDDMTKIFNAGFFQ